MASVMLLVAFMVCIISEDAEDGKASEENTLRFQSLFLRARLDGLFQQSLAVEDVDDGGGKKDEGDESDTAVLPGDSEVVATNKELIATRVRPSVQVMPSIRSYFFSIY